MECAGNGRARLILSVSQPWLLEAIGTGRWNGMPLGWILDEAGVRPDAVELLFTGLDRGLQGDIEQDYQRSLTLAQATAPEVLLAYELNGIPLEAQHGYPFRLRAGLVRDDQRQMADRDRGARRPFDGYQQIQATLPRPDEPELTLRRMRRGP